MRRVRLNRWEGMWDEIESCGMSGKKYPIVLRSSTACNDDADADDDDDDGMVLHVYRKRLLDENCFGGITSWRRAEILLSLYILLLLFGVHETCVL